MCRTGRVLLAIAALLASSLFFNVESAGAGTITIWPDQFKIDRWEVDTGVPARQNPDTITGNEHFYAILNIPVGATIKFVRVNFNNDGALDFCVYLRRKTPTTLAQTLIQFDAPPGLPLGTGSRQSQNIPEHVKGPLTVKAGYRYYIQAEPSDGGGSINSIQVVY